MLSKSGLEEFCRNQVPVVWDPDVTVVIIDFRYGKDQDLIFDGGRHGLDQQAS